MIDAHGGASACRGRTERRFLEEDEEDDDLDGEEDQQEEEDDAAAAEGKEKDAGTKSPSISVVVEEAAAESDDFGADGDDEFWGGAGGAGGIGGGAAAFADVSGIEMEWKQVSVDPLSGDFLCHLSFFFPDGSSLAPAFTYPWRFWGLRELQDVLADAGFPRVHVYWPSADEEGCLTGDFEKATAGTDDETFTCYVVAEA